MCYCSCWPSTAPERSSGWKAEMRHSVRGEKLAGLQIDIFKEPILWAQFLYHLLISKITKILHGDDCSLWLAESFKRQKPSGKYILYSMWYSFTKITYILTYLQLTSLEQFPRVIWDAVSWSAVLILPQIKFNSNLSCCVFFKAVITVVLVIMKFLWTLHLKYC